MTDARDGTASRRQTEEAGAARRPEALDLAERLARRLAARLTRHAPRRRGRP